jgi:hypothetical protein
MKPRLQTLIDALGEAIEAYAVTCDARAAHAKHVDRDPNAQRLYESIAVNYRLAKLPENMLDPVRRADFLRALACSYSQGSRRAGPMFIRDPYFVAIRNVMARIIDLDAHESKG